MWNSSCDSFCMTAKFPKHFFFRRYYLLHPLEHVIHTHTHTQGDNWVLEFIMLRLFLFLNRHLNRHQCISLKSFSEVYLKDISPSAIRICFLLMWCLGLWILKETVKIQEDFKCFYPVPNHYIIYMRKSTDLYFSFSHSPNGILAKVVRIRRRK